MSLDYSPKIITRVREEKKQVFEQLEAAEQEVANLEEQASGLTILVEAAPSPEQAKKARESLDEVQQRISDITGEIRELASALKELQALKTAVENNLHKPSRSVEAGDKVERETPQPAEADAEPESQAPPTGPVPVGRDVPQRWAQRDITDEKADNTAVEAAGTISSPAPNPSDSTAVELESPDPELPEDDSAVRAAPGDEKNDESESKVNGVRDLCPMTTQIRRKVTSYRAGNDKPGPSFATLEMDLQGIEWIPCKKCKKKFPDPGSLEFVKECAHCGYRFYANLTYEMRSIDIREKRRTGRKNRKQFKAKMAQIDRTPITRRLEPIHRFSVPRAPVKQWARKLLEAPLGLIRRWKKVS